MNFDIFFENVLFSLYLAFFVRSLFFQLKKISGSEIKNLKQKKNIRESVKL